MSRLTLRYALIITTLGVLAAFFVSIMPTFAFSLLPILIMLGLMLLLIVLHYWYLLSTPFVPNIEIAEPKKAQTPVILILGPYAAKWFSQNYPDDNARYSNHAAWLLIVEPKMLTRRLQDITRHAPGTPVIAFFPFLPDGHETSSVIIDKLMSFQQKFSAVMAGIDLPCVLAIYARLSNERRNNIPQNATWIGEIDFNRHQTLSYATAMENLTRQLNTRAGTTHDTQRAVMGKHLLRWLRESGIEKALSQVLTRAPFHLNNALLCDYGNGFNRHGAWSHWLEQRYALLPGLGSTLTLPPFPRVQLPVSVTNNVSPPMAATYKFPIFNWSTGIVVLLLSTHILNTCWQVHQQQQQFRQQIAHMDNFENLSIQTLKHRINELEQQQQAWSECLATPTQHYLGMSPCKQFVEEIEKRVAVLREVPTITTRGPTALFDSNSARPLPAAIPLLKEIESLVSAYPNKKVLIVGHSDNTGNEAHNNVISSQRAEFVREWLIHHGVTASRLEIRAAGAAEPIANNDTSLGRQQNRRVEIVILPTPEIEKEFTKR